MNGLCLSLASMINPEMSNTKRIAKNTMVLYVRMVIVLLITLYTSRILLKALGVDDYGLYSVVGGVVGLLTFFNGTMSKATQRFINVSMVKGNDCLHTIFSNSVTIHVLIAIAFLILGETLGLWYLNTQVEIPLGREFAANMVYQASIVSFAISIVTIPYNAAVIAYERMTFMAIVSIIDAVLKLSIAFILLAHFNDRLILYGIMLLTITVVDFILYSSYSKKKFPILEFKLSYDKDTFNQLFGYIGWTFVGQIAVVGCNQGNILLVNKFHALAANAAMTFGNQVSNALTNLTSNFQTAFNPQITKSYAEGDDDYLSSLVYATSKLSFCILFVFALPIAFNINWVLHFWLDTVPPLTNTFAVLFVANGIINAISSPFHFTALSSGDVRNFQIVTAVVFLLDLPVTYYLFTRGLPATTVMEVKLVVITVVFFVRVFYASKVVKSIKFGQVCLRILFPMVFTSLVTISIAYMLDAYSETPLQRLLFTAVVEIIAIIMLWFILLDKSERKAILVVIKNGH